MAPNPFREVPQGIEVSDYTDHFLAPLLGLADELDIDVDGHQTWEHRRVFLWQRSQDTGSYTAFDCGMVINSVLTDLLAIMIPPEDDGIGFSIWHERDPDMFEFDNDVLWGKELGAIIKQCKATVFDGFIISCHSQWRRLVNKCCIASILLDGLSTYELLDWTNDEFDSWVQNLKSKLKNECLELFKRYENFDYWVCVFARSRGIRDVQEARMSSRYWLS